MQQTKTLKLKTNESIALKKKLFSLGFESVEPKNPYIVWRMNGKGLTVMYYSSGSLVAQGEGDFSVLGVDTPLDIEFVDHIGSDEVGKGDYFGPLVVCCAYVQENNMKVLKEQGVVDSKRLGDKKMVQIFNDLKESIKYNAIVISPVEYNKGVKEYKNVSYFLASVHRRAVEGLIKNEQLKNAKLIIDQFSLNKGRLENEFKNVDVRLTQFHKGESDIAVACASVFARAIFVMEFEKMGEKYGNVFPKGASDVINFGKEFVSKFGAKELNNVAKVSFRTTTQILEL